MNKLQPVHPGEILKYDFMEPLGLCATALAKALQVMPARINEIVRGRRGITAGTALRLARYFSTDAMSWVNLQVQYELEITARKDADALSSICPQEIELIPDERQIYCQSGVGGINRAGYNLPDYQPIQ